MNLIYNFSAGPSMMPKSVLLKAKKELQNWNQSGSSIMEISHRSEDFMKVALESEKDLRDLLDIPDEYKVLFCQGGARGQFSAIPMNLINNKKNTDYINSGYWSDCAKIEAKKYCNPRNILITKIKNGKKSLITTKQWDISNNSAYIHYCPNETIDGVCISEEPEFNNKIIIGDFSSVILSRFIKIKNYALIYASAQKNIGPAGITLVIIREDLLNPNFNISPSILNYHTISKYNSMFNTPPVFSWYLSGLVFKWLKKKGGLKEIEKKNKKKSEILYKKIDSSNFYINNIDKKNRSQMNIVFDLANPKLNKKFLIESYKSGLIGLKGHRVKGGMRASLYNAMTLTGVKALINFMSYFENKYA